MKKFLKIGQLALVVMLLIGLNSCELETKAFWWKRAAGSANC